MKAPLSLRMAESVRRRYRPGMMEWHYEHGLVLYASLRAAEIHGDDEVFVPSYFQPGPGGAMELPRLEVAEIRRLFLGGDG